MAEDEVTLDMINDKTEDFSDLFDRMDKSRRLYFLEKYVMTVPNIEEGEVVVPDVINVTYNDPLTYATRAISMITSAIIQTLVEGEKLNDKQTSTIEQFLKDINISADERLQKIRMAYILSQHAFHSEHICIRGHVGERITVRKLGDNVIADIIPVDMRYCTYDYDEDGLLWFRVSTRRSEARIKAKYKNATVSEGVVDDVWTRQNEIVYVDEKEVEKKPHKYGVVPFIISMSTAGSSLQDKEALAHRGEDIYWANRDLYPELNRMASILQTLTTASFLDALQYESEEGTEATKPEIPPWGLRKVYPVEKGGGYKPMPVNDIHNSARLLYATLEARLQRGSFSALDYGNLTFPLSAVAITRMTAHQNEIILPRLQGLSLLYQQRDRMIIEQVKALGIETEWGERGSRTKYAVKDLDGDYDIKYKFFTKSPEQDIANYSVASAAERFLPGDSIRRNILQVEDPDGENAKFLAERAERIDPVIALYRRCCALIDQDDDASDIEARILQRRILAMLRQQQQLPLEAPTEAKTKQSQPLIPLLSDKGGIKGKPEGETEDLTPEEKQIEAVARRTEIVEGERGE